MLKCPNCNHVVQEKPLWGLPSDRRYQCVNAQCPTRLELGVGSVDLYCVVNDWWFLYSYSVPFKIDEQWHIISGPYDSWQDDQSGVVFACEPYLRLATCNFIQRSLGRRGYRTFDAVCHMPYRALPNNDDFTHEFNKLKDRIVNKLMLLV